MSDQSPRVSSNRTPVVTVTHIQEMVKHLIYHEWSLGILKDKKGHLSHFALDKVTKEKLFDSDSVSRAFGTKQERGNLRPITAPKRRWKEVSEHLLTALDLLIQDSSHSNGFKSLHSIFDNACVHKEQKHKLFVDIENAFGGVTTQRVKRIFKEDLGFKAKEAHTLTRLCTLEGSAPQGFPTSPKLLNLAFRKTDARLSKFCKRAGIQYSRYADDLTFSRGTSLKEREINTIIGIIRSEGWLIARKKLRVTGDRYTLITGVLVDSEKGRTLMKTRNKRARRLLALLGRKNSDEWARTERGNFIHFCLMGQDAYEYLCKGLSDNSKSFGRWRDSNEASRVERFMKDLLKGKKKSYWISDSQREIRTRPEQRFLLRRADWMLKKSNINARIMFEEN